HLQGLCAGDAASGRTRSAQGRSCALDQGTAGRLTPHMAEAIALIDYGAGNLHSVHNALIAAGAERVVVTADPALVRGARRIVLPGVGSFKACADGLGAIPGLTQALEERVLAGGVPFLGVCVGMQLLATPGLEHGETAGLAWISGAVSLIARTDPTS